MTKITETLLYEATCSTCGQRKSATFTYDAKDTPPFGITIKCEHGGSNIVPFPPRDVDLAPKRSVPTPATARPVEPPPVYLAEPTVVTFPNFITVSALKQTLDSMRMSANVDYDYINSAVYNILGSFMNDLIENASG